MTGHAARRAVLILSASMGAGHDAAAAELARRLCARGVDAEVADVLDLLPLRLGAALRGGYGWMMRSAPWAYELIYRAFFVPRGGPGGVSPMTALVAVRLLRLLRRRRPDEVVSAFHLAAQAAGHLRARGLLPVPSTVLLTDFAAHRLWLHPGNDRYLCPDPASARAVRAATGRPAHAHAPLVRPEFLEHPAAAPGDGVTRTVLVSAGAWGVGGVERTARILARSGRYAPVVLCGRNDELRRRLARRLGRSATALGWCADMPGLLAGAYALVDNAAGLTCREAMASGVPVVSFLPIPGHGRDGALAMARAGLSVYARDAGELLAALDRIGTPGGRERHAAAAAALFAAAPAESFFTPVVPSGLPGGSAATGPA
ncbi:MGDG synthase family glycosyltransferase [Microtetraspora malaysiensis]|uniref:MGDG synthase family glycosyltransferase n=1 Tax=Microtetraspora malaysiensis TaxID=161358 RepID=UPI003D8E80DF